MSIYGEGKYLDPETGQAVLPPLRTNAQLEAGLWEMRLPGREKAALPARTDETKPLEPTSIYAINKRDQEEMLLTTGRAYGIPAVALRYFNVYGPRQALSNPYTGIAAIFSSCYLNNKGPIIFEDGLQSRDFIHVTDIAHANVLALEHDEANWEAINVGTGISTSVLQVARMILENLHPGRADDPALQPKIVGRFRSGDIRHCFADISKARRLLGFEPKVAYQDGIKELIGWVRTQTAVDRSADAFQELETHKLVS
jgi:dTDP-L-rhamnose 4-epimerase